MVRKKGYRVSDDKKIKRDTVFVGGTEKSQGFETFARSLFVQDVKGKNKVMKDIQVVKIAENLTT